MVNKIPQKLRAFVLWESGHKTVSALKRFGKIPERTGARYIAEFNHGGTWERNDYPKREKLIESPELMRKVIKKMANPKKPQTSRTVGSSVNLSHTSVQKILHNNDYVYSSSTQK